MANNPSPIVAAVFDDVRLGRTNSQIIAAHPAVPPRTLKTYAALSRRKQNIPPVTKDPVTSAIKNDVLRGATNVELIAKYPHLMPNSVRGVAARIRTENGIRIACPVRQSLILPQALAQALANEATERGGHRTGTALAIRLLALIVKDDMFDAILDEGK